VTTPVTKKQKIHSGTNPKQGEKDRGHKDKKRIVLRKWLDKIIINKDAVEARSLLSAITSRE